MFDDRIAGRQTLTPNYRGVYANAQEIQKALRKLSCRNQFEILMVSKRSEYFEPNDLFDRRFGIKSMTLVGSREGLCRIDRKFDLAVVCQHAWDEHELSFLIRARQMAEVIAIWTFDNHHQDYRNIQSNQLADVVFPSHAWCASALNSPYYILGCHLPLCCAQWSRQFLSEQIERREPGERSNELSGGFTLWGETARDRLLQELADRLPNNAIRLIGEDDRHCYFRLSAKERLETWTTFKTSLCLPVANDVSFRIFDSLITGQIPIVPLSTFDIDCVISKELQEELPVVRIDEITLENVRSAWQEAVERFDADGQQGVIRRHKYALQHHHVSSRIGKMVCALRDLSTARLEWRCGEKGIGLFASEAEP